MRRTTSNTTLVSRSARDVSAEPARANSQSWSTKVTFIRTRYSEISPFSITTC